MKRNYLRLPPWGLILGAILWSILIGALIYLFGGGLYASIKDLDQVASMIASRYVEKVNYTELMQAGIEGMLESLDPYSEFLDEKRFSRLMEDTQGEFEGLGMEIGMKDGWLTVISPLEGTPAYRTGIQTGDRIIEIEGVSTKKMSIEEAVKNLRGPKGSKVRITVTREGEWQPRDYTIERDVIELKSVSYYGVTSDKIGYVRLNRFSETSKSELKNALTELKDQDLKGLILDLRGNPGGLLSGAIQVADLFLDKGRLVVETKGQLSSQNRKFYSQNEPLCGQLPLVVVVDQGSASGSEIVAGAIQDWDRGVILGDTTFGKGLVQSLIEMEGNKALKLTTAKYYIPSGRFLQKPEADKGLLALGLENVSEPEDTTEQKKERAVFYTKAGRKVEAEGGIIPDIVVEREKLSPFKLTLLQKMVFFDFAVHYTSINREISEDFEVDDEILAEFRNFLQSKELDYQTRWEADLEKLEEGLDKEVQNPQVNRKVEELKKMLEAEKEKDFLRSLDFIKQGIKENILIKLCGQSSRYEHVWLKYHLELEKAKDILNDQSQYKEILSKR